MKVLIPIAQEIEEMEAVILMDVLVRGGFEVEMQSITQDLTIRASRGVLLQATQMIDSSDAWDLILLPGGMPGAQNLRDSKILKDLLLKHIQDQKPYGAICASPAVVLHSWGILPLGETTCYPSFQKELPQYSTKNVCLEGLCYTSKGPGTAFDLALQIIEDFHGLEKRNEVQKGLLWGANL